MRAQVDVLTADKSMLEERLETTGARLTEAQVALNAASRDLAGLQVWREVLGHMLSRKGIMHPLRNTEQAVLASI